MNHPKKYFLAASAIVLLIVGNAAAQAQALEPVKDVAKEVASHAVKFEQIVPQDAWLVMGIDDIDNTRQRWGATPIGKWLQSDAVQALMKDDLEASQKKNKERLQE